MKNLKNFKIAKNINTFLWAGYIIGVWFLVLSVSKGTNMNVGDTEKTFLYVALGFAILYGLWSMLQEMRETYIQYLEKLKIDFMLQIEREKESLEYSEKEVEKISKILDDEKSK